MLMSVCVCVCVHVSMCVNACEMCACVPIGLCLAAYLFMYECVCLHNDTVWPFIIVLFQSPMNNVSVRACV